MDSYQSASILNTAMGGIVNPDSVFVKEPGMDVDLICGNSGHCDCMLEFFKARRAIVVKVSACRVPLPGKGGRAVYRLCWRQAFERIKEVIFPVGSTNFYQGSAHSASPGPALDYRTIQQLGVSVDPMNHVEVQQEFPHGDHGGVPVLPMKLRKPQVPAQATGEITNAHQLCETS